MSVTNVDTPSAHDCNHPNTRSMILAALLGAVTTKKMTNAIAPYLMILSTAGLRADW
ncbi:hypothetical protein FRAAL2023 [Frankia alni ACN14a]|uniref:Uncharacterized protein n=1 Tax=Frankia alni (strain DSM 45986 / CECT 9034 / ACN14a) TaxID=326424 RepID=Q0RP61_FRAAA|nr:hypothetical protein FRAAL2023 [Frankia alni ACN14a]